MKSAAVQIGAVLSVLLAGAGATLYYLIPPNVDEHFRAAIGTIHSIQKFGAEWSVETARVRADPTASFDGLAAFVPTMRQMKEELSASLARIPDLPQGVTSEARAYVAALDALRERIERFKTTYAVIRNSERYLPLVSADLILQAEQAADEDLAAEISDITREFSVFLASPNDSDQERLGERLRSLNERGMQEDQAVASTIANFVAHAEVLLAKRGRSEELFQGITSSALAGRVDQLTDSLEVEQAEHQRIIGLYWQGIMVMGAAVLIVWVFVGFNRRSPSKREPALAGVRSSSVRGAIREAGGEPGRTRGEPSGGEADSALEGSHDVEASTEREERGDGDVMHTLLTTGALAGLMGQSIGAYVRRVATDLDALRNVAADTQDPGEAEEAATRWRRLQGDVRWLGFFAQRLVVLSRHLAPKHRASVDVNECLDEVLDEAGLGEICTVQRRFGDVPGISASRTEIRLIFTLCIDYASRALQDMDASEAEIEVSTAPGETMTTISFVHNGGWLPPEQRANQFVPFYGSQGQKAGLDLPAALYLAKKYRGMVSIDTLPDERTAVIVKLPVDAGGA